MNIKVNKMGITIFLLTILPLVCCVLMCAQQGTTIRKIYLPNAQWNDEVFYYKWVEGVCSYGVPQGYFGYNESHANYLNFGTWSPVLNLFWVIFGKVSGWSLGSPIFCNILLMSLAMFLFALWTRPDQGQALALALLFSTHTTVTRFMLSGLSEISCYFLLILITGLVLKKEKEKWVIILMFLFVFLVSIMRPYYILLFFLPGYFWYVSGNNKKIIVTGSLAVSGLGVCTYIWINRNLCAPYFADLFHTEWIRLLFNDFWKGIFNILHIVLNSGKIFLQYVGNGVTGDPDAAGFISQGGWCAVYLLIMIWMVFRFCDAYKKKKQTQILFAYGIFLFLSMLLAVFLFFDVFNGSKHLVEFTVSGIFIMAMAESLNKKTILLGMLFIYLFTMKATSQYEWELPVLTAEMEQEIEYGRWQLENTLVIEPEADRWDNTVIWVLVDHSAIKWQDLYAFPAGIGINTCQREYVLENYDQLKARYLMTSIGEEIDTVCGQNHAELLAEYGQVHVWKLR